MDLRSQTWDAVPVTINVSMPRAVRIACRSDAPGAKAAKAAFPHFQIDSGRTSKSRPESVANGSGGERFDHPGAALGGAEVIEQNVDHVRTADLGQKVFWI